jgi:hypothetical protein
MRCWAWHPCARQSGITWHATMFIHLLNVLLRLNFWNFLLSFFPSFTSCLLLMKPSPHHTLNIGGWGRECASQHRPGITKSFRFVCAHVRAVSVVSFRCNRSNNRRGITVNEKVQSKLTQSECESKIEVKRSQFKRASEAQAAAHAPIVCRCARAVRWVER